MKTEQFSKPNPPKGKKIGKLKPDGSLDAFCFELASILVAQVTTEGPANRDKLTDNQP